ncbi:MAG: restriction endonuclease [Roseovarius sp.]|nr:restriction endonuclease [Roseovarius sp.]MCY4290583.1 restriction endonuclease [Roseovarius sp.]
MGERVGGRPVEEGYVAIGWHALGDIRNYPELEDYKTAIAEKIPNTKKGALPVQAGILYRFAHEIQSGDIAVYPSKHDRMVNIGRFTGEASYVAEDPDRYPNHRSVKWLDHIPRNDFSQSALNEIGSQLTMFLIKKHLIEFLAKVGLADSDDDNGDEDTDDDNATAAVSRQAEFTASDFVIRRIMENMTGFEFEELVAHLLECMGYKARVTPSSNDGGVDVIAHLDALGFQPPIIKVQCKRITSQTSRPDVDQLLGTLGEGEYGLYINLGSYSKPSIELERNRAKLRLLDGEQFVELVLDHYDKLAPRFRSIIPLKKIHVADLPKP